MCCSLSDQGRSLKNSKRLGIWGYNVARLRVPLIKQNRLTCSITALRMVLSYFGKSVPEADIIRFVGGIKSYGVKTSDLAEYVKGLGFDVRCYTFNETHKGGLTVFRKPSKAEIIHFLDHGFPVILSVSPFILYGPKAPGVGHSIVIKGYAREFFYYNDPSDGKEHEIMQDDLLLAWFYNIRSMSSYLLAIIPSKKHTN